MTCFDVGECLFHVITLKELVLSSYGPRKTQQSQKG